MTTQLSGITQSHLLLDQKMKDEQIQIWNHLNAGLGMLPN